MTGAVGLLKDCRICEAWGGREPGVLELCGAFDGAKRGRMRESGTLELLNAYRAARGGGASVYTRTVRMHYD